MLKFTFTTPNDTHIRIEQVVKNGEIGSLTDYTNGSHREILMFSCSEKGDTATIAVSKKGFDKEIGRLREVISTDLRVEKELSGYGASYSRYLTTLNGQKGIIMFQLISN